MSEQSLKGRKVLLHDMCLRDGMHAKREQISTEEMVNVARELGMDTSGFLMMAHLNTAEGLLAEARKMESYGANTVYVTDSAGYMLPGDVKSVVALLRENLLEKTELGFHGHNNMGMAIANSIAAIEAGASRIDASVGGLGAGAGNTPSEVFVAVCDRMGIETGCDLFKLMDMAEDIILPMMEHVVRVDRSSLTMGYAGVYSTFLLHANRIGSKYGIATRDILVELGQRKMIGGQEDMIEDTTLTMAKARGINVAVAD